MRRNHLKRPIQSLLRMTGQKRSHFSTILVAFESFKQLNVTFWWFGSVFVCLPTVSYDVHDGWFSCPAPALPTTNAAGQLACSTSSLACCRSSMAYQPWASCQHFSGKSNLFSFSGLNMMAYAGLCWLLIYG